MSNNVFNNNHEVLSDEENIDPYVTNNLTNISSLTTVVSSATITKKSKSTSKTFISMASESDSGYSVSATPSAASPAINSSREATDSPIAGSVGDILEDTEAGPDINDDEFKSANEIFKDPSSFDFLSQHGTGNEAALALARQSLYVKFDPLIGGRPSIMPKNSRISEENDEEDEESNNNLNHNADLIAMNSPSPSRKTLPKNQRILDSQVCIFIYFQKLHGDMLKILLFTKNLPSWVFLGAFLPFFYKYQRDLDIYHKISLLSSEVKYIRNLNCI